MADLAATFDAVRVVLEDTTRGAVLARGAATGTVRLRFVDRAPDDDLVFTLAREVCTCARDVAATAAAAAAADLTVYLSSNELVDVLTDRAGALRVAGRRELLVSLASILKPPQSPLAVRGGA